MKVLNISDIRTPNQLRFDNNLFLTTFESKEELSHPEGTYAKMNFSFIIVVTKGELKIGINQKEYVVAAGQMLVCNLGAFVEKMETKPDSKSMMLGYYVPFFFPEHRSYSLNQFWDRLMDPLVLNLDESRLSMINMMFAFISNTLSSFKNKEYQLEAMIGHLRVTIAGIGQWYEEDLPNDNLIQDKNGKIMAKFIRDVREYSYKERTVSFYAAKYNLTPKYFSSIVYKISGVRASEWIRKYTIITAKGMLKSHQYTVQQISEKMYFPNPSFFGKYFKEAVGMTPRQYMMSDDA